MHRTTTTATLLVTMAISALTGCTTVQGPIVADPSAAGAHSSAPRAEGPAAPAAAQAPAREALERTGSSRDPGRASGKPRRTAPAQQRKKQPADRSKQRPRPDRPEAPVRERAPERPPTGVPDVPLPDGGGVGKDAGNKADVCALGKQYGGWRPGSPEAVICERTHRR
ncbi:hypothetical protein [Streptomyces lancefieldiae]|uniref:Lipoprotein n=1 Tax=Streptomyces lancefieldiae TaxID=3075520 RepID=A0ABU3ALD5_9ACTN|nr:hypothetical protein [Streptomyces sp. DSM 40712]MDT0611001.1 hypothetical protein [Streptomyces sp. DSM 40712]